MNKFQPAINFDEVVQAAIIPERLATAGKMIAVARRSNRDDTGHYDDSLEVFHDERGVGGETLDIAGHIIEYGAVGQPAQAPLRTGAMAVGRFDPL